MDVERNLRAPLVGIAQAAQRHRALLFTNRGVAIRTGDTPAAERARFLRHPGGHSHHHARIVIPAAYLQLARFLRSVETVIIDEIHALVPSKRGSHLALSLERLQHLVRAAFATHRSFRYPASAGRGRTLPRRSRSTLGGNFETSTKPRKAHQQKNRRNPCRKRKIPLSRPSLRRADTEIDESSVPPRLPPRHHRGRQRAKAPRLRVEVPVEDMARLDELELIPSGPASQGPSRPSIWSAIHPKLLELIRAHRSTLIFVNSRRLAERISGALNELAGEALVRAHHGSVAVAQRKEIEDRLKLGTLRGFVATSSLELGIDMGAIDLVIQIESPPSVASGMQRVGRASHSVGAVSTAVIYPKYRADLVACAAITRAMYEGNVETRALSAQPAGRAGPADCRDGLD